MQYIFNIIHGWMAQMFMPYIKNIITLNKISIIYQSLLTITKKHSIRNKHDWLSLIILKVDKRMTEIKLI